MPLVLDFLVIPPIVRDANDQGCKKCGIRPQTGSNSCESTITANLFIIALAIVKKDWKKHKVTCAIKERSLSGKNRYITNHELAPTMSYNSSVSNGEN